MSRYILALVAWSAVVLASSGALAATAADPAAKQGSAKIKSRGSGRSSEAQSGRQQQQTGIEPDGVEDSREAQPGPAYLAEVQAITGKKMRASFTDAPPVIDGNLDDREWSLAEIISDFQQRDPEEGEPGSERTEVRILYDNENIYLGFMMYDREPTKLVASDLRRDSELTTDDTITVVLDTFHDHRNGFLFRVNPLGTQYDALLRNEQQINSDWNEKWYAAARITAEGWVAEMKIPLRALRFNAGSHVWGIDFQRQIRRKNEEAAWSNYRRGFRFNEVSQGGHLVGLLNIGLTQRFRFQPYAVGSNTRINAAAEPNSDTDYAVGIEDFKVQITANLTADFTVNTDFAQVEDDNEQVNLTRFPLFFPEKRSFFLESANNFSFGTSHDVPDVVLYFSRRIGLVSGNPTPISYGAKMTGKIGSSNIGLLNVQTGDSELAPGQNYTAMRIRQDILGRSKVGAILTSVQGSGEYNRVAGVDADFTFLKYLNIQGFVAGMADSDVEGTPMTGYFTSRWSSDRWTAGATYLRVDPGFNSDLGFIRRRDISRQNYELGWNPRPAWASAIRQFGFGGRLRYLTDIDGRLLTRTQNITTSVDFESGDRVFFNVGNNFERLDQPFFVSEDVVVPIDDYNFTDWFVRFESYSGRAVSGSLSLGGGGYFNGTRDSISPTATVRFNEKLSVSPSYSFNRVLLPDGSLDTHLVGTQVIYSFNERWLTNSLVQYNSVSGRMSVFVRLRFAYNPIDNFFLVYKETTLWDDVFSGVTDRSLIAKLTYSLDF